MKRKPIPPEGAEGRRGEFARPECRPSGQRPGESLLDRLRAEGQLAPLDLLLVEILGRYCQAEGNAICWPSSAELARLSGVVATASGRFPKVARSLAKLEALGLIWRIARHRFAGWMQSVGRAELGLDGPRTRASPARFIVLRWKLPDPGATVAERPSGRAGAPVAERPSGRAGATWDGAPARPGYGAPARPLRTCSKSELPKGTLTLTGSSPGGDGGTGPRPAVAPSGSSDGERPTAAAPVLRTAAEVLADLESKRSLWKWPALVADLLWELHDIGAEIPERFRDKLPARRPSAGEPEPPRPSPAPAPEPARTSTVDLVAALARPGATDDQVTAAARKLAEDLDDLHSLAYHRKVLGEARAGTIPVKAILGAHRASRGVGIADRRKVFTNLVERAREDLDRQKRPRPGPPRKVSRAELRS